MKLEAKLISDLVKARQGKDSRMDGIMEYGVDGMAWHGMGWAPLGLVVPFFPHQPFSRRSDPRAIFRLQGLQGLQGLAGNQAKLRTEVRTTASLLHSVGTTPSVRVQ